jgi:hypothetical protein
MLPSITRAAVGDQGQALLKRYTFVIVASVNLNDIPAYRYTDGVPDGRARRRDAVICVATVYLINNESSLGTRRCGEDTPNSAKRQSEYESCDRCVVHIKILFD